MSIPGKDLLLFWRAALTKTNFKKTERGKSLEIRGNLPKYVCRGKNSPVMVNLRWRKSSTLDSEDYKEPILVETGEEHSNIDA